jgi:hypothetical protein
MGIKQDIQQELINLENQLITILNIRQDIWSYHPSNPDFINPITMYEDLSKQIVEIERKINYCEREISELN